MKCPVCSTSDWIHLFPSKDRLYHIPGSFHVLACRSCGLWMIDPPMSEKKLRKYYPKTYYSYGKAVKPGIFWRLRSYVILHSRSTNIFHRFLKSFIQIPAIPIYVNDGKILDVGCGSGETLQQLKRIGWKPYGVDIDRDAIIIARKRKLTHVELGTYKDINKYPNNYFDVIRLYLVIEHLNNPRECLQLALTKLKPKGQLIVGTANTSSIAARLFGRFWVHLDSPRHCVVFSDRNLRQLIESCGFKYVSTQFSSGGGIVCSIQFVLFEYFGWKFDLIGNPLLVFLFYPLEWLLDRFGKGDIFTIYATK